MSNIVDNQEHIATKWKFEDVFEQDIIHRGELSKKKGQTKYRQYICQTVFPMPDGK